jgi:hypothetical protein
MAGTHQRGREPTSANQGRVGSPVALLRSPDGTLIRPPEAPARADPTVEDPPDAAEAGPGSPAAVTVGGGAGRTNRPPSLSCVALSMFAIYEITVGVEIFFLPYCTVSQCPLIYVKPIIKSLTSSSSSRNVNVIIQPDNTKYCGVDLGIIPVQNPFLG